mmetsp:Transcript_1809/g.2852  ORF Transcript_1809/g.2852 Transcript_1809/m.2852 type:complete len:354 (+) Transcript_1809:343-1404(+)
MCFAGSLDGFGSDFVLTVEVFPSTTLRLDEVVTGRETPVPLPRREAPGDFFTPELLPVVVGARPGVRPEDAPVCPRTTVRIDDLPEDVADMLLTVLILLPLLEALLLLREVGNRVPVGFVLVLLLVLLLVAGLVTGVVRDGCFLVAELLVLIPLLVDGVRELKTLLRVTLLPSLPPGVAVFLPEPGTLEDTPDFILPLSLTEAFSAATTAAKGLDKLCTFFVELFHPPLAGVPVLLPTLDLDGVLRCEQNELVFLSAVKDFLGGDVNAISSVLTARWRTSFFVPSLPPASAIGGSVMDALRNLSPPVVPFEDIQLLSALKVFLCFCRSSSRAFLSSSRVALVFVDCAAVEAAS